MFNHVLGLQNPFCVSQPTAFGLAIQIKCAEGVIDSIPYAFYGNPIGDCPSFTKGPCDDPTFASYVNDTCLGQSSCVILSSSWKNCQPIDPDLVINPASAQAFMRTHI